MSISTTKTNKPSPYSEELRADLLKHFEAGKGHISLAGKLEIKNKHGLSFHKTVCWANDRRRRHGLYDERRFCRKLWKFMTAYPNRPPTRELQEEFQKILINIVNIHGWTSNKVKEESELNTFEN